MHKILKQQGVSLLEIILVVAITGLMAGVSLPVYHTFQLRNSVDDATFTVISAMRRSQEKARALEMDSDWGVKVQTGMVTIFMGNDFSSRDQDYDENFDISTSVTPSGLLEVYFNKSSSTPSSTGTLTLTSATNEVRTITVNSKGMLEY